jgi:Spy/CpxP family protein refolding chaperone
MGRQTGCNSGNNVSKTMRKKEVSMKNVLGGLLLSALLLAVIPGSSYADRGRCEGPAMRGQGPSAMRGMQHEEMGMEKPGHRIWKELRRLNLDERQRTAARDIWSAHMKDAVSQRADMRIARIELRDILAKEPVDMQAVGAKLKQIASLQSELRFSRIKAMEDVKALLTPEQRKKLREDLWNYRGEKKSKIWGHGRRAMPPDGPRGNVQPDADGMD